MNLLLWTARPDIRDDARRIERLHQWGYDSFEVVVGELDAQQVAAFAGKAAELGMVPKCADLYSAADADLIGPAQDERRRAIQRIKSSIHKARDMGSKLLSGPIYQGLGRISPVGATADEWKWAVDGLHQCALEAQECGIRIAAEPLNRFEMHIVNTIEQAFALCEEVALNSMGILADTHHSNIEELDVVASYVTHVSRIYAVHISENNRGIPGSGHAIPPALFGSLRAAGYTGDYVIEAFNGNVPELRPLVRVFAPLADSEDRIAIEGLRYIKENL